MCWRYADDEYSRLLNDYELATSPTGEPRGADELDSLRALLYSKQEALINLYVQACWIYRIRRLADDVIRGQRRQLMEECELLATCDEILGIEQDPVSGKRSPTGIELPKIEQLQ